MEEEDRDRRREGYSQIIFCSIKVSKTSLRQLTERGFCYPQEEVSCAIIKRMKVDFLSTFLGNAQRARILRLFVFNQAEHFTLGQAAKRSGLSLLVVTKEIKSLEGLDIIKKRKLVHVVRKTNGNGQKASTWILNPGHKHVAAIAKFVYEVSPIHYDSVMTAVKRSGRPTAVILSGCFMGDPSRPADLIVAADGLNEQRLEQAVRGLEPAFGREIRYAAFTTPEFRYRLTIQDRLIRDTLDYPHLVLLDRTRLL
ncbi:MAG: hypothetical protein UY74_C0020G0008 [Candidatus Kaiserbacteria bacterium GW2011_GWC2_52_8b]|uniref:Transcriptional regulator n=2 Tax=Candidatus Kaiseribacteriota TaxID=1752734 RepID=A0A0G1XJY1_9BACT|nr:MAG: hypothetical protein UY67_C0024G0007 [Candidatus Kaiserbacteria bacterium GW2011_GWA2_52_12]KKW31231.1 MAG: hypothetical protein UY74_C0020G0008 [Candidatus Kaiserbacteria bacterium GW2011_GWC2_52_8b]